MHAGQSQTDQRLCLSSIELGLTQDFNFHWLAAIELCHTLNLCEGNIVSALKTVTSLI